MKVAVVTPYYKEPLDILARAYGSVERQTYPDCVHVMVADGFPRDDIGHWDIVHIHLPQAHGDNGNTPRARGMIAAIEDLGCDAVTFLDADNWLEPDHVASLVDAATRAGTDVAASGRVVRSLDEDILLPNGEVRDGFTHFDTSCFLLRGRALETATLWLHMPPPLTAICDTLYWYGLLFGGFSVAATRQPTLNFQSHYMGHHMAAWRMGSETGTTLPCRPNRLFAQAEEAFLRADARGLIRLFRSHVPGPVQDETEDAAMLRLGTTLAHLGIAHHALVFLRAVAPGPGAHDAVLTHNLAAVLARQVKWDAALAGEAETALRAAAAAPAPGAARLNLVHFLAQQGRIEDAARELDDGCVPTPQPVNGHALLPVGNSPFQILADHSNGPITRVIGP